MSDCCWQDEPSGTTNAEVSKRILARFLAVDDGDHCAVPLGNQWQLGGRVDYQRTPDHEEQVGRARQCDATVKRCSRKRLTKKHGGSAQNATTDRARWIEISIPQPALDLFPGERVAAIGAANDMCRSMKLDDKFGTGTGALMQPVDVLRDDARQFATALQLDQRDMGGIWLGGEQGWV